MVPQVMEAVEASVEMGEMQAWVLEAMEALRGFLTPESWESTPGGNWVTRRPRRQNTLPGSRPESWVGTRHPRVPILG
jgi:hypothetical protein